MYIHFYIDGELLELLTIHRGWVHMCLHVNKIHFKGQVSYLSRPHFLLKEWKISETIDLQSPLNG